MERIDDQDTRLSLARLWRNATVRRQALFLTSILVLSIIAVWIYSHVSSERLKEQWLDQQTGMVGRLSATDPEAAKLWIKSLTASEPPSSEALERGRQLMERYGLTSELEGRWLPVIGGYQSRTFWTLLAGTVVIIGIIGLMLFLEARIRLGDVRRLAVSLDNSVKHNKPMAFRIYGEGEMGLLANGVQELTIRLQETIEQLHRDKAFLKDTVADISHQLKTPLSSLIIYMDLLREGKLTTDQAAEFLETCRRELDRMEWLTLSLLKIARLEANALEMNLNQASLIDTVRKAVDAVRRLADNQNITLLINEPINPIWLPHDPQWLAEALANVVKNALEHSPPERNVEIGFEQTPVFVRVYVKDYGTGIDERELPHIFKKFYRTSPRGSGVGLGLPLAKSVVEKHGGIISAANHAERGTIVTITLPLHPFPSEFAFLTKL
ncbi:sensor histidine kinase [Cohnella kolymensis]|uniref:sensor histidine kinase n=1 Tax=Cohnella kolymensis TaxID=1590652 RepID=UPI0006989BF8|nr:HAMP domain-containing sensor histidine kinase [Cohnella kolymensis]